MFELGLTDGVLSTLLGRLRGVRMKLCLLFSFFDISCVAKEFSYHLSEAAEPLRGDGHV